MADTSTVGLKQQKYRWGLHVKETSRRNQEEGKKINFIYHLLRSVDGSSIRFQPEMASWSACLCRRGVSSCRGGEAQPHHTRAEVAAKGSQWWSRVQAWPLAIGHCFDWALLQKLYPWKQLESERQACLTPAKYALGVIWSAGVSLYTGVWFQLATTGTC